MPEDSKPQSTAKRPRSGWRWLFYLVALILIAVLVLSFTGHLKLIGGGGSKSTSTTASPVGSGYLAATATSVIFIQWNQLGTDVAGVAQLDTVENQPLSEVISVKTTTVTGQINKSNVSVNFQGFIEVFGTMSGGGFILDFPQPDGSLAPVTFRHASASDYNEALAKIRDQVSSANATPRQTTSTS
jgi:hypothetical protein